MKEIKVYRILSPSLIARPSDTDNNKDVFVLILYDDLLPQIEGEFDFLSVESSASSNFKYAIFYKPELKDYKYFSNFEGNGIKIHFKASDWTFFSYKPSKDDFLAERI